MCMISHRLSPASGYDAGRSLWGVRAAAFVLLPGGGRFSGVPGPTAGNLSRMGWMLCVAGGPLIGVWAVQIAGHTANAPGARSAGGTGRRKDSLIRDDLKIPVVLRIDCSASGFASTDLTGTRL